MVAEFPRSPHPSIPQSGVAAPAVRYRYRLRFRKIDSLRLVSHHDLMHVFERMVRRADLPLAHTQGFHPQPRIVFALSLALGIAGSNEVLDLELTQSLDPADLHDRLAAQAPPGLTFLSARRLEGKSSSLVRRAFYRLPLPSDSLGEVAGESDPNSQPQLRQRCEALFAQAIYGSSAAARNRAGSTSVLISANSTFAMAAWPWLCG